MKDNSQMLSAEEFLARLDEAVAEFAMLKHPFYQLWSAGKLDQKTLAEYAKQYYAHVKAFPTYVSAVHSHSEDLEARQLLLENLIEEERGGENHPELWIRFAEALGQTREEVREAKLLASTKQSVQTLKRLTQEPNAAEGLAALYAYESQIPEVAKTKREGLKEFYGIEDERSVSFFKVHEDADVIHRQVERALLLKECSSAQAQEAAIGAARAGAKALWDFLDGVHQAFIGKPMACQTAAA